MPTLFSPRNSYSPARTLLSTAVAAALLAACGGGDGDSPVAGSGGTPVTVGMVSGFGSVYIDGERYDDSAAETGIEDADGQRKPALLKLGQRVRALHDGQGKASRLIIDAAVIGTVSAVDPTAGALTVAAQIVRINTDAAAGPLTRFGGGYETLADILSSDDIEVHGSPVYDSAAQRYEIHATRIDKLDSRSQYRVSGLASGVTADSLRLNGLTVAYTNDVVRPTGASVTDGVGVVVFGTQMVGDTLTATAVRVLKAEADAPPARTQVALGGFVSAVDIPAGTLVVDGQTVRLGTVQAVPPGATVAVGGYVSVGGVMAADGIVDALRLSIRTPAAADELARIRLAGEITDLVEGPSFLVRGVPVDASAVTPAAGCPSSLSDGTLVQVKAQAQPGTDVVLATEIQCAPSPSLRPREIVNRGMLWPVDAKSQTFGLNDERAGQRVTVRWDDKTVFLGLPKPGSAELEIQMVRSVLVEGYQAAEDGTVIARVVRDISAEAARREGDRFRRAPVGEGLAEDKPLPWVTYRQQRPR